MSNSEKLTNFGDPESPVTFIEYVEVKDGVDCDVYSFDDDQNRDLAVVTVAQGVKTPRQLVLDGVTTTEGYISGKGTLSVESPDGHVEIIYFDEQNPGSVMVKVGDVMQWTADPDSELVFSEVCIPPFEPGRFENLPE